MKQPTLILWAIACPFFIFANERAPVGQAPSQKQIIHTNSFVFDRFPEISEKVSTHKITTVAEEEKTIELSDGSLWNVSLFDRYKVKNWSSNHRILLTQNPRWFSKSIYRLINQDTGSTVDVSLVDGPWIDAANSLKIKNLDLSAQKIELSDGTFLEICDSDQNFLSTWKIDDFIILGFNSGSEKHHETLVLNVRANNHTQAKKN